jgi:hypothetical protein
VTKKELVAFLRSSLDLHDPELEDSVYLGMTDETLSSYIDMALIKDFPNIPSVEFVSNDKIYLVMLSAKREVYYALATSSAPLVSLSTDNTSISRNQRFEHYMRLITQLEVEYKNYLENGGDSPKNELTSYDVIIPSRSQYRRNYEKSSDLTIYLVVSGITSNSVNLSWVPDRCTLEKYTIFYSTSEIYDDFAIKKEEKISSLSTHFVDITDPHQTKCRVTGLLPDTTYYFLVLMKDRLTQRTGYSEVKATTLKSEV